MTLYCAYCRCGQEVGEELHSCQRCGSMHFTTARPGRPSLKTWTVTDRRFLRSLRIRADDDEKPAVSTDGSSEPDDPERRAR